jgi:hypothetical protein
MTSITGNSVFGSQQSITNTSTVQESYDSLASDVQQNIIDIAANESDIDTISVLAANNESAINAIGVRVSDTESDLTATDADVTALEVRVASTESDIVAIETKTDFLTQNGSILDVNDTCTEFNLNQHLDMNSNELLNVSRVNLTGFGQAATISHSSSNTVEFIAFLTGDATNSTSFRFRNSKNGVLKNLSIAYDDVNFGTRLLTGCPTIDNINAINTTQSADITAIKQKTDNFTYGNNILDVNNTSTQLRLNQTLNLNNNEITNVEKISIEGFGGVMQAYCSSTSMVNFESILLGDTTNGSGFNFRTVKSGSFRNFSIDHNNVNCNNRTITNSPTIDAINTTNTANTTSINNIKNRFVKGVIYTTLSMSADVWNTVPISAGNTLYTEPVGDGINLKFFGTYKLNFTWSHTTPQGSGDDVNVLVRLNGLSTGTYTDIAVNELYKFSPWGASFKTGSFAGNQSFTVCQTTGELNMKYQHQSSASNRFGLEVIIFVTLSQKIFLQFKPEGKIASITNAKITIDYLGE